MSQDTKHCQLMLLLLQDRLADYGKMQKEGVVDWPLLCLDSENLDKIYGSIAIPHDQLNHTTDIVAYCCCCSMMIYIL